MMTERRLTDEELRRLAPCLRVVDIVAETDILAEGEAVSILDQWRDGGMIGLVTMDKWSIGDPKYALNVESRIRLVKCALWGFDHSHFEIWRSQTYNSFQRKIAEIRKRHARELREVWMK